MKYKIERTDENGNVKTGYSQDLDADSWSEAAKDYRAYMKIEGGRWFFLTGTDENNEEYFSGGINSRCSLCGQEMTESDDYLSCPDYMHGFDGHDSVFLG